MTQDTTVAEDGVVGRLWAVRIAAYGHPSSGVLQVVCADTRCRTAHRRFTEPAKAREAALEHLAAHARRAGALPPLLYCRCRSEDHAWHAGRIRCTGGGVRVLSVDATRTSWRMVETCRACAGLMPRAKLLTGAVGRPAGPPVPGVVSAGDVGSPAAPADQAANLPRQSAARAATTALFSAAATAPVFAEAPASWSGPVQRGPAREPAVRQPLREPVRQPAWRGAGHRRAVQRALSCELCEAQGVHNPPPVAAGAVPRPAPEPPTAQSSSAEPAPVVKALLTARQGCTARMILAHAATFQLPTTDVRLLATLVAVRAAREGRANLVAADLAGLRLAEPQQALDLLAALGWRFTASPLTSDPSRPAVVEVPGLGPDGPLEVSAKARARIGGWFARTIAARPLRKADSATRLAALYLAAHANPDGGPGALPQLPSGVGVDHLRELLDTGWLAALDRDGYQLAEALGPFVPADATQPAPGRPDGVLSLSERQAAACDLLDTSPVRFARWLAEYWDAHGHGPGRSVFIAANWPTAPEEAGQYALDRLGHTAWVAGAREPYALRPGDAYRTPEQWQAQQAQQVQDGQRGQRVQQQGAGGRRPERGRSAVRRPPLPPEVAARNEELRRRVRSGEISPKRAKKEREKDNARRRAQSGDGAEAS
ncbi:hypothetical protein ACIGXM_30115 [Kitasatospora sp. NPDC052896]|uniref:hypothetical protein n=1 Tax=Kitasatospora sp. NPDC052896 TaxID=3364061 RepID=UPI0037C8BFD7